MLFYKRGQINARLVQASAGWSKRQVIPGLANFDNPNSASHFLYGSATIKDVNSRVGGTYGFNLDVRTKTFLQQRFVAFYNSQCCGVSFDYQKISGSSFASAGGNRFGVSFTLAGLGSFSNPFGNNGGGQ